jgi:hypothetical protein
MTITTEEAEWLADWVEEEGGLSLRAAGLRCLLSLRAAGLRCLADERDALKAEKVNLQDDLASVERERAHQQGRADRNAAEYAREQKKREQLQAENAWLRDALRLAIENVEFWAAYASPYFQDKHDLAGDLQKLRAALGEKE